MSPVQERARGAARTRRPKTGAAAADLFNRMNDERARPRPRPARVERDARDLRRELEPDDGVDAACTTATSGACSARSTTSARTSPWAAARPASSLHVAWMHSQDHRDNILSPGFTDRRHRRVLRGRRIDVGDHRLRPAVERGSAAALRRRHAGQPDRPARRQHPQLLIARSELTGRRRPCDRARATAPAPRPPTTTASTTNTSRAAAASSAKKSRTPAIVTRAHERRAHRGEQHDPHGRERSRQEREDPEPDAEEHDRRRGARLVGRHARRRVRAIA